MSLAKSYDVVVIGSGGSGLTSALASSSQGASVAVLEKGSKFGGSTSLSGGQLWIPNNGFQKQVGIEDSKKMATKYLTRLARGRVDHSLVDSFVRNSPKALDFIVKRTPLRFAIRQGLPDYHPEWEGGLKGGRTLDPGLFDGRSLGDEYRTILHNPQYHLPGGLHTTSLEFEMLMRGEEIPGLKDRKPSMLALGEALVGGLRKGLVDAGVPLFLSHGATRLVVEGGRVAGVEVNTPKGKKSVRAKRGVILAAGGFDWNLEMKKTYLSAPSENSAGCLTDTGDGIAMGIGAGAATSLMDEAWWFTLILKPGEKRGWLSTSERTLPGSIVVNPKGKRFADEAQNYVDLTRAMLAHDPATYSFDNIPAYLVFDSAYLSKYPVAKDRKEEAQKWLVQGQTIMELAEKLGVDAGNLAQTVSEFNKNAEAGVDPEYHRGESAYDRHWGDPSAPNPTLGPLATPPFHGARMLAGDIGTKGGITTDAVGRALDGLGEPIPGLYAVGNNAASVMGPGYAGSGATLGPCLSFGYLAGLACVKSS